MRHEALLETERALFVRAVVMSTTIRNLDAQKQSVAAH